MKFKYKIGERVQTKRNWYDTYGYVFRGKVKDYDKTNGNYIVRGNSNNCLTVRVAFIPKGWLKSTTKKRFKRFRSI